MIRNKENLSFVIDDNSVKLIYNKQVVIFNTYSCASRHKFNKFKQTIQNSPKNKYNTINDVYGLANRFEVRGSGGRLDMIIHKNIAY